MKGYAQAIGSLIILLTTALSVSQYLRASAAVARIVAAEKKVKDAEQFNSNIVESAPWPMIVCEAPDTVVTWNKAAETFTGWSKGTTIGGNIRKILPADQYAAHQKAFLSAAKALRESKNEWTPAIERRVEVIHRSGAVMHTDLMVRGIKSGDKVLFIAAFRPILEANALSELKEGQADRWRKQDMIDYVRKFKKENPEVKLPSIDDEEFE